MFTPHAGNVFIRHIIHGFADADQLVAFCVARGIKVVYRHFDKGAYTHEATWVAIDVCSEMTVSARFSPQSIPDQESLGTLDADVATVDALLVAAGVRLVNGVVQVISPGDRVTTKVVGRGFGQLMGTAGIGMPEKPQAEPAPENQD